MPEIKYLLVSEVGKRFGKNDYISLDNTRFANCSFDECNFLYSGGPFEMVNCQLRNSNCEIQGVAGIVLHSLSQMGWRISPPDGVSSSEIH
jgi:hypothetical protein